MELCIRRLLCRGDRMRKIFKRIKRFLIAVWRKIVRSYEETFYVNGSDTLPPPLSAAEEADALQHLELRPEARTLLIEHNLRLVVYIAKKFDNTKVELDDIVSIGTIGLIKSISGFDHIKNIKLATFA